MATPEPSPLPPLERSPEKKKWVRTVVTPGLLIGLAAGVVGGLFAIRVHPFLKDEQTILLFMASSDVAILAVILTATTVATAFLQGFFGRVTQTSVGLLTFFFPFIFIAGVSGTAALVSFAGAMNVDSHVHETVKAGWFGLAAFLTTWAIAGIVWLIIAFTRKASEQRKALTAAEQDEEEEREENAQAKAASPPSLLTDAAGELERLTSLYAGGALTDEEFRAAKAKALGKGGWLWHTFRQRP